MSAVLAQAAQRRFQHGLGLAGLDQRPADRADRRLQQLGGQAGAALQPALGRTQPRQRTAIAANRGQRVAQRAHHLLAVHERVAALRQLLLLAGLRRQVGQLALAVTQILFLAPGGGQLLAQAVDFSRAA